MTDSGRAWWTIGNVAFVLIFVATIVTFVVLSIVMAYR